MSGRAVAQLSVIDTQCNWLAIVQAFNPIFPLSPISFPKFYHLGEPVFGPFARKTRIVSAVSLSPFTAL
jgi:hypothetical protein